MMRFRKLKFIRVALQEKSNLFPGLRVVVYYTYGSYRKHPIGLLSESKARPATKIYI